MSPGDRPLVSIGVPVYNGAAYFQAALESLLSQTYPHLELIISDNASTDDTPIICREFAARDTRIRYSRNTSNLGATYNFQRVLDLARGPLFMWAAHDDEWEPEFVEANVNMVLRDPTVIASISKVEFMGVDSRIWKTLWAPHGTSPLMGPVRANVMRVLWNPGTNSRVYAIFRTEVLRRFTREFSPSWGNDTTFVIKSLRYGKYAEVPRYLMRRRRGASINMRQFVLTFNTTSWGRLFPFWEATQDILHEEHVPKNALVLLLLLKLNALHTGWYYPGFPIWTDRRPCDGVHRAARPVRQLIHASQPLNGSHSGGP